jgi:zinc transport system permease protein
VIWALGMAIGLSFIMATPGYNQDLMSFLFGNILMVAGRDITLMLLLDGVILAAVFLFYNKLLAISFNEELARLRGIRVEVYELLFLLLTALTVVLLVQVVGIVLVIALLTLPAATAGLFVRRLWHMMALAVAFCLFFTLGGLVVSYAPDWPAGATIIELAGVVFLGALWIQKGCRRLRRVAARGEKGADET